MHPDSRSGPSYAAVCSKFPRLEGMGFVSKTFWSKDAPFMRCRDINGGACPMFETRKQPEE